ncbi:UNVERIFIED_CONTAM: hypothetical protein Sradi_0771900 [Sesamum radiatum]|uniref:DUF4283 domain-containing protein n=1 Tax=Sesamum radiatum TaxID=300843 RepID=A0AAW2VR24_SESRA
MDEVIEGCPWLFQGQPIVLQKWEPGMVMRKHSLTNVPVWIRLRHLPTKYWTDDGLSMVASGVGKPLYQDAITRQCGRLDYARVCILLQYDSTLPKHVVIKVPPALGGEVHLIKVDIEYEWIPPKCKTCKTLGHSPDLCPSKKDPKKWLHVYVPKPLDKSSTMVVDNEAAEIEQGVEVEHNVDFAIPNINPLPKLDSSLQNTTLANQKGGIRAHRSHSHATSSPPRNGDFELEGRGKEIVIHNQFEALEQINDGEDDYAGNRIWILWDVAVVDVDILDSHTQFIHLKVALRSTHTTCFITVVYGNNNLVARRQLWQGLTTIANGVQEVVMGDFNSILDQSEICGQSSDQAQTMAEFGQCLLETDSFYYCGLPRTSDHSTLVLDNGIADRAKGSIFRFDNFLTKAPGFLQVVQSSWHYPVYGTAQYSLAQKLKRMKPIFRKLRRDKGDLHANVKMAEYYMLQAQN